MNQKNLPTDQQITDWLQSEEVLNWVHQKLSKHCPPWKESLQELEHKIKQDKHHDWTIRNTSYPNIAIGVNASTWTLWIGIRYDNGIFLAPDCPFGLQSFSSPSLQQTIESTPR